MCGIAGYFGPAEVPEERIGAALASLGRRGPDHAAWRTWTNAAGRRAYLLHTRLSIIDLDPRAHQPYRAGTTHLVYNGEVYNYVELRRELERAGVAFDTTSDTEVLARGLERHGPAFLDRCEGMWAFALYDEARGTLLLGRDRFGEKPLVLHRDGAGGLWFASEPKALFALLGRRLPVDLAQIRRFLVLGYKVLFQDVRRTFFRGLEALPPATVLAVEADGAETERRYWTLRFEPDESMGYEEAVAGVRERLARAIEIRLRADVPLAFCMSGGVDSNVLIAAAKRLCGFDVHGFTIATDDARYDERDVIAAAVCELGIRHTEIPMRTDGFLDELRAQVRYHDAPVSTITWYAHRLLEREMASAGYRISVSGSAADEIFTGYYDHHLMYLAEVRSDPALHAAARAAWERNVKPWVRNPFLADPDRFVRDPSFRDHIFLGAEGFATRLVEPFPVTFAEARYADSLLRNRTMNELFHESVPVLLHEDDRNAMEVSMENRSPYLDRALVEFAHRVPVRHLVRDGLAKALLREAARGVAPEAVLANPRKVGFNLPIAAVLDTRDPATRAALLAPSPVFDVVRRDAIQALLGADGADGAPSSGPRPNSESKFLFSFASVKMFLEEFS